MRWRRPAGGRGPRQAQAGAGTRLRRRAAPDCRLQPEPAARCEPGAGRRLQRRRLAPRRVVQRRALAHRNASGSPTRAARGLARRHTGLQRRRTHPHREFLQVHPAGLFRPAAKRRVSRQIGRAPV
ncbi:hypothetical protein G6F68_013878 [Rhizopus microsporus]|nr:hypothetical protein G6F68_013878 [Rhizopus microsporus]